MGSDRRLFADRAKPCNFADRDYFLAHAFTAMSAMFSAARSDPPATRLRPSVANQLQPADFLDTGEFAGVAWRR